MKLSKKWTKHLRSMPESGMGYQLVDVVLKGGRVLKEVYVYNAEELILPVECKDLKIKDIADIKLSKQ